VTDEELAVPNWTPEDSTARYQIRGWGAKPALLIAFVSVQPPGGLIICNGYNDQQYIADFG
jgi:arginine decarboxylase-like protein